LTRRCRILIVEDEAITALALEQALLAQGYEVCGLAASGAEARALAERLRPNVAVVDMRLKDGVTGAQVARDLQARLGIPVILMSGHADHRSASALGAAGFLAKPFSDADLIGAIATIARRSLTEPAESDS
jgi:DNA-binding NtrC family response regulator